MTAISNSCKDKDTTPGEELYLVHLRRLREEDDDHDYLPRKRRSSSVGEELWEVHRRRSQGMEEDIDRGSEEIKHIVSTPQKKPDAPKCRYNLRSKDSATKKA